MLFVNQQICKDTKPCVSTNQRIINHMQKNYLIVGGSSGIGRAIVEQLVNGQHTITILSRNAKNVTQLAGVQHFEVDIAAEEPTFPVLSQAIDGLIYCPGTINLRPFKALKPKQYQQDFNINVLGAVKTIRQYLPLLKKANSPASIVLFSTVAVQTGMAFHASIAAAKGAVEGLTRSLAAELAPDIRVNAIAPSLTDTPLAAKLLNSEVKVKAAQQRHPLKAVGQTKDIADAAIFLLQAQWVSGQILQVDGGMSAVRLF